MDTTNLKVVRRERDALNLSARELNEYDDPLHNILRDVLTSDFFREDPER